MVLTVQSVNTVRSIVLSSTRNHSRSLFYWVRVMFNSVDQDRVKEVGPDRACAEWLLRNGACVRWKSSDELFTDYNKLLDYKGPCYIEGIVADNAGICDVGFEHLKGCNYVRDIKLENCKYVDNYVMPHLELVKETLNHLELIKCPSVDDEGLLSLKELKNLQILKVRGLPYIKKKDSIKEELTKALPNCKIDIE